MERYKTEKGQLASLHHELGNDLHKQMKMSAGMERLNTKTFGGLLISPSWTQDGKKPGRRQWEHNPWGRWWMRPWT